MRIDLCRFAAPIAIGLWRPERATADTILRVGVEINKQNAALLLFQTIAISSSLARAEETGNAPSRHMTLQEAVQLALKHNHDIRIAGYTVEEKRQAKEVAKSSSFPSIRNDSSFMHVTDTQLVELNAGSLGVADGTPIPPADRILNQGGRNLTTSGTQITQPLTTLLKIKQANDMARAEVKASREKAQLTGNDVALAVHQVYYKILIAQAHRSASEARIKASENLQSERVQQVKFGSALEQDLIDSRAQLLQAKQELLTTDLQLSDLNLKLNDLIGLPLTTALDLDPAVAEFQPTCLREECVRAATASHPEILAARAEVEKAQAAARLAKTDMWVPDVEAFARHSYQNNVPFLAHNFGTFGIHFGFDVFDAGRKKASLRGREAQLSQAKENLAKLTDEVELAVETAYNKLDRTQQMLKVSEEVVALRTESNRVMQQKLLQGAALNSQAETATAQEYDATALLLQSRLDYLQAHDELLNAIGRTPE
jgi:outer membrane protein TolC